MVIATNNFSLLVQHITSGLYTSTFVFLYLCYSSTLEVVIGFDPAFYNVSESDGEVLLTVRVLRGELGRPVEVNFSTDDGVGISKYMLMAPSVGFMKI